MPMSRSVPVLYYHRVGTPDPIHLSVPITVFERQMQFLARHGVRAIFFDELVAHLKGEKLLEKPAVAITFDDGFLDNLVNAAPILKKYSMKATVFMATSLIRLPEIPPAAVFTDFNAAHISARRGNPDQFLSREELYQMFESGIFEIHSHSHSHRQVFVETSLTGFFPKDDKHWGILSAYDDPLADGIWPVFPRQSGLTRRALFPQRKVIENIMKTFPSGDISLEVVQPLIKHDCFRTETECDFEKRIRGELEVSRRQLSDFHKPGFDVFCLPWGKTCPQLQRSVCETGYAAVVSTRTGSNSPGDDPFSITRFPVKKADIARFALGFWLRSNTLFARFYQLFHGFF